MVNLYEEETLNRYQEMKLVEEHLKREYHSIHQTDSETSTKFMQRFLRLARQRTSSRVFTSLPLTTSCVFCLRMWLKLPMLLATMRYSMRGMMMAERPDKRQKSGDRHQPTTQQSSHRNHGHNNDRHRSDRRGGGDNHRSNNNYSGNNNRSFGSGRDQRNRGQQSNRPVNSGECRQAAGTGFKCGQTGHLQKDCKKNTAREYHSIRQTNSETSTEFMQHFLRLAGFLGVAAGTGEEQAKNFQLGLRRSTLNHLMCMSYTDVAQVANAACNYEILHERDDDDAERPDKRQKSGISVMGVTRETWVSSLTYLPILVLSSLGVPLRATPTQLHYCGQAGHLQKDCKKNTTASTSDGLYCRHCALLRKKLKEVWFTICDEHKFFQDFLNIFESSNDNSNVVNAPQEPIVFNQDPGENSLQSPPHIDHHCYYGCGDSLDGIFCQRCTYKYCEKGAHYGYNCPSKVSIISNPEPCHNQNVEELAQTLLSFHPTCYSGDENSFAYDSTPDFVNYSSNVFNPPSQPPTYSNEFCGKDAHYSYDCPPQKIPICYDDDDDEESSTPLRDIIIFELPPCIVIIPILSTKETKDSLIMGDGHLDTIPEKESDEFIKSSVENLVPNPSESEEERECDVPIYDDFTTFSNLLFDADDDFSSSDNEISAPSIISSSKIDSLLDEFVGKLILLKSIPPRIDEADCDTEEEIRLIEKLFDPFREEIDLFLTSDGSIPPSINSDYSNSEGDNLFPERLLHDDPIPLPDILDLSNVIRIFPPLFTYPVRSLILLSSGSEDTIFDPGISNYHFSSFMPGVSHRCGTFIKFNVYPNHLNESPMEILSSTCSPMDQ
nr:hypothetical protein [Tanacetum cinerariifolium]